MTVAQCRSVALSHHLGHSGVHQHVLYSDRQRRPASNCVQSVGKESERYSMSYSPVLARLRSISPLRLTLFGITFLEEMISGFPTIGLPLARDLVPMTYTQIGLLFSIGALASILLDPLCNILTDLG